MATTLGVTEMLPSVPGVYQIKNKANNRIYVGSSVNLSRRHKEHFRLLILNKHPNHFLQNDFNKNPNFFSFFIIEFCERENLLSTEQKWLNVLFDNQKECYNFSNEARARFGEHSIQTKQKISSALINKPKSKDHRLKINQSKEKFSKPIYQATLDGEILEKFKSISFASKSTNIAKPSIMSVLKNKRFQAGGFLWVSEIDEVIFAKERYLQNKNMELLRKRNQFSINNPRKK